MRLIAAHVRPPPSQTFELLQNTQKILAATSADLEQTRSQLATTASALEQKTLECVKHAAPKSSRLPP